MDSETNSLLYTYSYDHAGRSLETWISVNGNSDILLSQNQYNDLGELKEKNLHCADQSTLLQSVDYEYNIRGWLTVINEPGNLEENDVFAMELYYDQVHGSVSNNSQYNGNISAVVWTSDQSLDRSAYKFDYDPVNRISAADFTAQDAGTWGSSNSYGTDYSYDLNGNITTLQRYDGSASLIDNLTYSYTGNQLQEVQDATNDEDGFSDDGSSGTDYTYDVNGNMTTDLNKQITVSYNHLNLPKKVEAGGASSDEISYIYDAVGTKWFKQISNSSLTDVAYCGSFVYKDAGADGSYGLDYMLNPEGRIDFDTTGDYAFSYLLKDHLGNTRATLDEDGNLLQQADYYPFGMAFDTQEGGKNKYLYNGKELQDDMLGSVNLDLYDYGSRFYDPLLGRFPTIDPKAESFCFQSPYSYAANNPILYIDKNGESPGILGYGAVTAQAARDRYGKPGAGGKEYMQAVAKSAPLVMSIAAGATPIDAVVDAVDTYNSIKEGDVIGAVAGVLAIVGADFIKDGKKVINAAENTTSRQARRKVMRQEGIPTSQQPKSQSKNASGREYSYDVPKEGGGTKTKSVQQQTKDANHQNQPHWEAGDVKTDDAGNARVNDYNRPKLKNDKSKENYGSGS